MLKKIVLGIVLVLAVVIGGGLGYLTLKQPAMAAPSSIRVERTPERVARGKYLFEHVSACWACHSESDGTRFGSPVRAGGLGKGMVLKDPELPGRVVASNLTPDAETGLGNWTDGEILRAMREGIGKDGRALFPMMPYTEYRALSDEDAQSLVAYLRSLTPVRSVLPKTEISFPVNLLIKSAPQPVGSVPAPIKSDPVAYGKYLTRVGGCQFCHTPAQNGQPIPGREFSGGHEFVLAPEVKVVSYNLTPHQTGTGTWTEQQFLDKFRQYREYAEKGPPTVDIRDNTIMPWLGYAGMADDDLRAIWAYLKTVPGIENAVETTPNASPEARQKK